MNLHALCLGERVAQFEERDIGVLRDQFFDEAPVRRQLARPGRAPLNRRIGMAPRPDLPRPPGAGRGRNPQSRRSGTSAQSLFNVLPSMYFRNRVRSADGKGADMVHSPEQDESHRVLHGNPNDSSFSRKALAVCFPWFGGVILSQAWKKPRWCLHNEDAGRQSCETVIAGFTRATEQRVRDRSQYDGELAEAGDGQARMGETAAPGGGARQLACRV